MDQLTQTQTQTPTIDHVVTIELTPTDAHRLLWLVQREAAEGCIWDAYWRAVAQQIHTHIFNP